MRSSMPGSQPATYDPDAPRDTSDWDRIVAEARIALTQQVNDPAAQPDEFAIAAAKVERRQERLRDAAWHRARMALGG
jgi:hypothetical protein